MVSPVRVLHVLATPRAEGTPNLVLDWLAARPDWPQGVAVLNSRPADLTGRLRAAASWYAEDELFDRGPRKFPAIVQFAARSVAEFRPDVVVCWPTGFSNWVCLGARLAGCRRLLVHAGNPAGHDRRNRWLTRYVTWPLSLMRTRVVCCSDYVRDSYRAVPGVDSRLFVTVYNCTRGTEVAWRAADARAGRPAGDRPTAIMVATLEGHKDHRTLLRAVPAVRRAVPGFRLWLVGDGRRRAELGELAAAEGVADAVEFLGTRPDVPALLGRADLFVFSTTLQEGLGSVLLEALAAGVPAVATDVPACRELLRGGEHGRLVPPEDPAALAAAICAALSDPPGPGERGRARDYATGFTAENMIRQYLLAARLPAAGGRPASDSHAR